MRKLTQCVVAMETLWQLQRVLPMTKSVMVLFPPTEPRLEPEWYRAEDARIAEGRHVQLTAPKLDGDVGRMSIDQFAATYIQPLIDTHLLVYENELMPLGLA